MALLPHFWTVAPRLRHALVRYRAPPSVPWAATVEDPRHGLVHLYGALAGPAPARELVLLVHGLGGNAHSHYMVRATTALAALGVASLRLNLRGSEGKGEPYYHAALTADLETALASPELARFTDLFILGFSVGGHIALQLATRVSPPRLRAVAAVSSPLDLGAGSRAIDASGARLYRRYVLASLVSLYRPIAACRPVPLPIEQAAGVRRLREWDERIVAPYHGFAGADDYHNRASVGPRLGELRLPALCLHAEGDPMIPAEAVRPALAKASPLLEVRWSRTGGHVGFPSRVDFGLGGAPGVAGQVLSWFRRAR